MNNKNIIISIILPCYNCENTILYTLNSIAKQTFTDYELIIINDGSKDRTKEKILDFINMNKEKMCIEYIERENRGFAYSLDEGIKYSKGIYIARIDSDDIWNDNHLEILYNKFKENNKYVLIGTKAFKIDEKNIIIGKYEVPIKHNEIIKFLHKDNPFIHSSVMFKKEKYNLTKGYYNGNDIINNHIADYRLFYEMSKLGLCENINDYNIMYRVLNTSMSRKIDKIYNLKGKLKITKEINKYYKKYKIYSLYIQFGIIIKIFIIYIIREIRGKDAK
jgi:glycosyltransferase involved in cell wall biosynthesis